MTPARFRTIALSMPGAFESEHMAHPDFRVGEGAKARIFASLTTKGDEEWGMVKLSPGEQARFMKLNPGAFVPASGAWGRAGATMVLLGEIDQRTLRNAVIAAWRNTAPKEMVREMDGTS
ncbi:MAG TPA: MmcQ/YjbR family DNA-binding protein [Phycisphaerales bacterium]|nr:MmcQ/YjbR family DNA-binding protein [Phycisphaerales bacterium]